VAVAELIGFDSKDKHAQLAAHRGREIRRTATRVWRTSPEKEAGAWCAVQDTCERKEGELVHLVARGGIVAIAFPTGMGRPRGGERDQGAVPHPTL
jgi:hypothetical protein